jgi:hypothetical protein
MCDPHVEKFGDPWSTPEIWPVYLCISNCVNLWREYGSKWFRSRLQLKAAGWFAASLDPERRITPVSWAQSVNCREWITLCRGLRQECSGSKVYCAACFAVSAAARQRAVSPGRVKKSGVSSRTARGECPHTAFLCLMFWTWSAFNTVLCNNMARGTLLSECFVPSGMCGVEQWYSTGGTRRHPKIIFFVI